MAAAYVRIFCNDTSEENRVRTYGGNRSEVRRVAHVYRNMGKETFLKRHPFFADRCKDEFRIICEVVNKQR